MIEYRCTIRHVPTYILPAIEIRLLERFHLDSLKTERIVGV